jgi:hypothetical protein
VARVGEQRQRIRDEPANDLGNEEEGCQDEGDAKGTLLPLPRRLTTRVVTMNLRVVMTVISVLMDHGGATLRPGTPRASRHFGPSGPAVCSG